MNKKQIVEELEKKFGGHGDPLPYGELAEWFEKKLAEQRELYMKDAVEDWNVGELARDLFIAIVGCQNVVVEDAPHTVELAYALANAFLDTQEHRAMRHEATGFVLPETKKRVLEELIQRINDKEKDGGHVRFVEPEDIRKMYPELYPTTKKGER